MWLVLCDPGDEAGRWAYEGLRDRGLTPLELVAPRALVHSRRSWHRVGQDGASFEIELPGGRTLASREIEGVLNRVPYAPVESLMFATRADTSYAWNEVSALMLSWLNCLAPVAVNRPTTQGLPGAWRSAAEWAVLAAEAGLPVSPVPLSSRPTTPAPPTEATPHTVVVFREHVFGAEQVSDLAEPCRRLARLAGTDLLGIDLHGIRPPTDPRHPVHFASATPLPDLRLAGSPLIDRLHHHFTDLPAAGA